MSNPVKTMQSSVAEYRNMDKKDRKRYWSDLIFNNALYILMAIFVVTKTYQKNFGVNIYFKECIFPDQKILKLVPILFHEKLVFQVRK